MEALNALTNENIQKLLELKQQIDSGELIISSKTDRHEDRYAIYELPAEILEDLETTGSKALQTNVNPFVRELYKFDGGRLTKTGAINPVFTKELSDTKTSTLQYINSKYKDAERLRCSGRSAAEIFEEIKQLYQNRGEADEDLAFIMEKVRRLAI
jgi:hypothetical protein